MHLKLSAVSLEHLGLAYLKPTTACAHMRASGGVHPNGIMFLEMDFSLDAIAFYTNVDSGLLTAAKRKPFIVSIQQYMIHGGVP